MTAPTNEQELLLRARALEHSTVGQLADALSVNIGNDPLHTKGSIGQLVELALGATAGSLSIPDFPELGIELKTIPIGPSGQPKESTHVCTATLQPEPGFSFYDSCVAHKLARVLWLPVEGATGGAIADRQFGRAQLWSPNENQWQTLRDDWEEIHELICQGQVQSITARHGEALQLRPKGANARSTVMAIGPGGRPIRTNPRAFYLRPKFTATLLSGEH